MGEQQDWTKATYLRKIIKNMKTQVRKCSRTGNMKGGVILTDETVKPYMEELAKLEAKFAKEKKQMSTGERVDTAAAEVMADAEQNNDEILAKIAEHFAKLAPTKLTQPIHKWAYIAAEGSGDYYKTPSGQLFPRCNPQSGEMCDIAEAYTFIHKVRIHKCTDQDLDMYRHFHEDGKAESAKGIDSFQFISQVGTKISLKGCALPPALEQFAGMEGKIENEPLASKAMSDKNISDISSPTKTKRGNSTTTRKVRREFLEILDDECDASKTQSPPLAGALLPYLSRTMSPAPPEVGDKVEAGNGLTEEVSTACGSAGASLSLASGEEEDQEEVTSSQGVEWVNDPTPETKAHNHMWTRYLLSSIAPPESKQH